jgi:hypothetical protein
MQLRQYLFDIQPCPCKCITPNSTLLCFSKHNWALVRGDATTLAIDASWLHLHHQVEGVQQVGLEGAAPGGHNS